MTAHAAGPDPVQPEQPASPAAQAEPRAWLTRTAWNAVSGVTTAVLLTIIYLADHTFFLVDDKRNQYLPVVMDIGHRLRAGEWLPVIDPNLGISGNFSIDIQYGLFDPSHWLVAMGLSHFSNLDAAAFVWMLLFEVILAVGTSALASRLRMPAGWAAAAGLAVATSGWILLKLAPDWMPGLVSVAWLPWIWWAWLGSDRWPRARDLVGIAVFSFLVISGGWPSTWLAFGALLVGLCVESGANRDSWGSSVRWLSSVGLRLVAAFAGVICAGLSLVPLYHAEAFTIRGSQIQNDNFLVANLADIFAFAAPQLEGDVYTFGHQNTFQLPVFFAVWFAVVVFWCTRWDRRHWRLPGVVTSVVGCVGMLLLTQAPSSVGALRDPIRQLAGVQFFFAVGVCCLAASGPWVVSRARIVGIALTLAAMGWLSWARLPDGPHSFVGIVATVAAAGVVLAAWRQRTVKVVLVLATTFGLTLMSVAIYDADQDPTKVQSPLAFTAGRLGLTAADEPIFASYTSGSPQLWDEWQTDGVGRAFSDLRPGARIAPGYSSLAQRFFRHQMCITSAQGPACIREVQRLFAKEPTTQVPWADLLGYRTIVVAGAASQRSFVAAAGPEWHPGTTGVQFKEFRRTGPISVAGRITHVIGQADVSVESVTNQTQSYRVTSAEGATLVFRDIYWPGYVATLNGHRLPVRPLDGILVSVALPAGSHGTLQVSYVPLSRKLVVALPAVSAILLLLACGYAFFRRRREDAPPSAGVAPEPQRTSPAPL